jgi:hypothetical protein
MPPCTLGSERLTIGVLIRLYCYGDSQHRLRMTWMAEGVTGLRGRTVHPDTTHVCPVRPARYVMG